MVQGVAPRGHYLTSTCQLGHIAGTMGIASVWRNQLALRTSGLPVHDACYLGRTFHSGCGHPPFPSRLPDTSAKFCRRRLAVRKMKLWTDQAFKLAPNIHQVIAETRRGFVSFESDFNAII